MDQQQLITAIRALADDHNVRLTAIEKELNMPRNSLSGMLNDTRAFPKKWQRKLIMYLEARNSITKSAN